MSRYLFTICGRAGSKGIKNKNSSMFLGLPLAYYTLAAISLYKKTRPEDEIVVALNTDSDQLRRLFDESDVDYVFVARSESLAGDSVGKVDVIRDTFRKVRELEGDSFDAVVDFDITSPLRTVQDVESLIDARKTSRAGVVFTVTNSRRNPYFNMVRKNEDGTCSKVISSSFTARQQAPQVFDMNASMYAYSQDFMNSEAGMFDEPCDFVIMRDTAILDLDNPEDLELMQIIAQHLFDADDDFRAIRDSAAALARA